MNKQEYLDALHEARTIEDKWVQGELNPGLLRVDIGGLNLITNRLGDGAATWLLWWHGELLTQGTCQTLAQAKEEVLQYAEHYVRTVLYDSTLAMP